MKVILAKRLEEKEEIKDIQNNKEINYSYTDAMQKETARVSEQVELMLIIGKKKNEYSEILYEIARRVCNNAMLIETMDDLYLNYIRRFKIVGIVATEEMPEYLVERIVEILQNTQTEGYMYENSR